MGEDNSDDVSRQTTQQTHRVGERAGGVDDDAGVDVRLAAGLLVLHRRADHLLRVVLRRRGIDMGQDQAGTWDSTLQGVDYMSCPPQTCGHEALQRCTDKHESGSPAGLFACLHLTRICSQS